MCECDLPGQNRLLWPGPDVVVFADIIARIEDALDEKFASFIIRFLPQLCMKKPLLLLRHVRERRIWMVPNWISIILIPLHRYNIKSIASALKRPLVIRRDGRRLHIVQFRVAARFLTLCWAGKRVLLSTHFQRRLTICSADHSYSRFFGHSFWPPRN